jgi:hypothetical protein
MENGFHHLMRDNTPIIKSPTIIWNTTGRAANSDFDLPTAIPQQRRQYLLRLTTASIDKWPARQDKTWILLARNVDNDTINLKRFRYVQNRAENVQHDQTT